MKTDFVPALGLINNCRKQKELTSFESRLCEYLEEAIDEINDWKMRLSLAPVVCRVQVYGPTNWMWNSGKEGVVLEQEFSHTARLMDIKSKDEAMPT